MTRSEALKQADAIIEELLRSGDGEIFAAARRPNGTIDHVRLVSASLRAREKLADKIMQEGK